MIVSSSLSKLYSLVSKIRYTMYEKGFFSSGGVDIPIISVGNLISGGTGKTPFIDYLISWAKENDLRPVVVSRGYKRESKGIQEVILNSLKGAKEFGDEPVMLKLKHPEVPIWVGLNRLEVSRQIFEKKISDIIFADDAFQHHVLKRNLDIVIIDGSRDVCQFDVIPRGLAREPLSALKRADVVVINRVNLSSLQNLLALKQQIKPYFKEDFVESEVVISDIVHMGKGFKALSPEKKYVALSAIGRPENFQKLLKQSSYIKMIKHYAFNDHHNFLKSDLEKIRKKHSKEPILITEKDASKLREFVDLHENLFIVKIKLNFVSGKHLLREKLEIFLP